MSQLPSGFDIHLLTSVQKLDLISALWDSLPETPDAVPLPDWHRQELENRLVQADANPQLAVPWEEVERRLKEQG